MDLGAIYGLETNWKLLSLVHEMAKKQYAEPNEEETYELAEAIGEIMTSYANHKQGKGLKGDYVVHTYIRENGIMSQTERA